MDKQNRQGTGQKLPSKPEEATRRAATKKDAIEREIASDPQKAAELLRELLKGRR